MAVVATFEFDDLIASSESASEPNARHRGLSPAVDHSNLFDRGNPLADEFRHFNFEWIWNAKAHTARGGFAQGVNHHRRRVSQNCRAPCSDVIDVLIAIDIPDVCTFCTADKKWFATDGTKCAHGRIDAAWNTFLRFRKKLLRTSGHKPGFRTSNIQHRTSNVERRKRMSALT